MHWLCFHHDGAGATALREASKGNINTASTRRSPIKTTAPSSGDSCSRHRASPRGGDSVFGGGAGGGGGVEGLGGLLLLLLLLLGKPAVRHPVGLRRCNVAFSRSISIRDTRSAASSLTCSCVRLPPPPRRGTLAAAAQRGRTDEGDQL